MAALDRDNLASISAELREVVDAVTLGDLRWEHFVAVFGSHFPGAFVAMIGRSDRRAELNFMASHNLDPVFGASFTSHYAAINPWNRHWAAMRSGDLLISEEMAPARLFRNGPFYEEWLRPQGRVEAGAGLQLRNIGGDQVFVSLHYDAAKHQEMAPALRALYLSIRGHLARAVRLAELMGAQHDKAVGQAAVLERDGECAWIVDGDMIIRDANDDAEKALSAGVVFHSAGGRLMIGARARSTEIPRTVRLLATGMAVDRSTFHLRVEDEPWRLRLTALPRLNNDFIRPFRSTGLVLVQARNIAAPGAPGMSASFGDLYGLTQAELAFCERLLAGRSVEEAAEELRISRETARQRLKAIFRKTDTHRQSQLLAMLIRAR